MSIADELHALHDKLFREERILRSEEDVLARAVEALRKSEKTEAILRAVCSDLDLRACARCQRLHMHHHVCYHCGHDPSERLGAAPRKPLIGCHDCTWHGGYLMSHCEEHARPSAAEEKRT